MKINPKAVRISALLLAVLMLTLCGCRTGGKDSPTIEIITNEGKKEVPLVTMVTDILWESDGLRNVLLDIPGSGQEFQVEFEALPRKDPDRSNRLTRMRTEMMAGKGPDLFLLDLDWGTIGFATDPENNGLLSPVFAFPEKAMDNRLFLPLDEYMENARFTDFERILPVLMEACRNDEGQQLIPLGYNFGVGAFNTDVFDIPMESTGTRQDMLESGSLALEYYAGTQAMMPLGYFGRDADFDEETLAFTEDELFEEAIFWQEHWERFDNGYFQPVLDTSSERSISIGGFSRMGGDTLGGVSMGGSTLLVPSRNRDGGVTAYVTIIGAVNRNTPYPDYAFSVLDKIASESVMRRRGLYDNLSMVTNMDLGGPDKPLGCFPMSEQVYERYLEMRDEITDVKFPTAMEQTVYEDVYIPCVRHELKDEAAVRAAVHKAYMTMLMMLAES